MKNGVQDRVSSKSEEWGPGRGELHSAAFHINATHLVEAICPISEDRGSAQNSG